MRKGRSRTISGRGMTGKRSRESTMKPMASPLHSHRLLMARSGKPGRNCWQEWGYPGRDKKPYWGDYELAKASGPYGAGEERVAGQTEKLTVTGVVKDEEKTYTVEDADWWNSMEVGASIHGLADSDGKLVKDEDD